MIGRDALVWMPRDDDIDWVRQEFPASFLPGGLNTLIVIRENNDNINVRARVRAHARARAIENFLMKSKSGSLRPIACCCLFCSLFLVMR